MWFIRSLIILVGVIAFLWVGMNNADQRVDFKFFTKEYQSLSLNLLLLLVFSSGMVFSFLIAVVNEFQLRSHVNQYRRELARRDNELSALRNLPLDESEPVNRESDS